MHHNNAFEYIETYLVMTPHKKVQIVIEDARKRKWFGSSGQLKTNRPEYGLKAQGAGAIKFCTELWQEWAKQFDDDKRVEVIFIHPIKGGTKWSATQFKNYTEWKGVTNEHNRDAGVIALYYPSKSISLPNLAKSTIRSKPRYNAGEFKSVK